MEDQDQDFIFDPNEIEEEDEDLEDEIEESKFIPKKKIKSANTFGQKGSFN